MHEHLLHLHRISGADREGFVEIPREIVALRKKEALSLVLSFLMERKHIHSTSGDSYPIGCEIYSGRPPPDHLKKKEALSLVLSFLMERKHIHSTSGDSYPISCELYSSPTA